ncbi:MAG TPA: ArgE/DapE family deacylase [Roseiflexaceae bacterium]|nr:ArgE/DapE family deacylase [Roseiflexaceae bacterium]HMP39007.1 ArgE/DapE family deacylase [Roseiflexaceae bacterium]
MLNATEQRVLDAIDMPALIAYLCELVAVRSLDGEESAAQEHVAAQLQRSGMDVDRWQIDFDTLRRHPSFSWEVERSEGLGVVGAIGADTGGRSLIFNGHIDVVPAGDEALWRYPPWRGTVADGRVYGRGALDMKGGLCCAIYAARAIRDAGVKLRGRLFVESVIGEEDGGCGALATVLRGYRADGAVVVEPTELCVAPAQAGALNFRIHVPGMSAHGCVREEGVSAIEKFFPIYQALMAFERQRNDAAADPLFQRYTLPYALCIGKVEAGNWASTVAEELICEGRFGIAVREAIAPARAAFEATVAAAAAADPWLRDHQPRVEWWGGQFAPAHIPSDHPIATTVAAAFGTATGAPARMEGMTYGSDMRHLVNDGDTPTVLFGPGDVRNAHRPDEYVPIADLEAVTQTLALTALRFCGYEE